MIKKLNRIFLLVTVFFISVSFAQVRNGNINFGLNLGILNFISDNKPDMPGLLGEATLGLPINDKLSLNLSGTFGKQQFNFSNTTFVTQVASYDLLGFYRIKPAAVWTPILYLGGGAINFKVGDFPMYWDATLITGGGAEIKINPKISLQGQIDYRWTTGDDFDMVSTGGHDTYFTAKIGVNYFFKNKTKHVTKEPQIVSFDSGDLNPFMPNSYSAQIKSNPYIENRDNLDVQNIILLNKREQLKKKLKDKENILQLLQRQIKEKDTKIAGLLKQIAMQGSKPAVPEVKPIQIKYSDALISYNNGDYSRAAERFSRILDENPTHQLASNCQYWIGECAFAEKKYDKAVLAFEKTLQYNNSPKIDDALLMAGLTCKNTGQYSKAADFFLELLEQRPDSEYLELARENLFFVTSKSE